MPEMTAVFCKVDDILYSDLPCAEFRTCLHKKCVRFFGHNFVADKAKIRRWAVARQGFLTQSAAKFAEKTCAYACEDRFLHIRSRSEQAELCAIILL